MGMMYRLFLVPTKPTNRSLYLYIQEKDGLSIITSSALGSLENKPLEEMLRNCSPSCVRYFKAQFGLYQLIQYTRIAHRLYPFFLFFFVFRHFRAEIDSEIRLSLANWLFPFYTEPPIGSAKVLIINENRMVFWRFNIIFNLKFLVISDFCI